MQCSGLLIDGSFAISITKCRRLSETKLFTAYQRAVIQSANPAARVGHYTRTISTSTQNASTWSLTAAAPSDSVSLALCTNLYLLTYLLTYRLANAPQRQKTMPNFQTSLTLCKSSGERWALCPALCIASNADAL